MPEIQEMYIFRFCGNMLFAMISLLLFEFFIEIKFLNHSFWPYVMSYAGHLRVCQLYLGQC